MVLSNVPLRRPLGRLTAGFITVVWLGVDMRSWSLIVTKNASAVHSPDGGFLYVTLPSTTDTVPPAAVVAEVVGVPLLDADTPATTRRPWSSAFGSDALRAGAIGVYVPDAIMLMSGMVGRRLSPRRQ